MLEGIGQNTKYQTNRKFLVILIVEGFYENEEEKTLSKEADVVATPLFNHR